MSVSTRPGATALTRTPREANSRALDFVSPSVRHEARNEDASTLGHPSEVAVAGHVEQLPETTGEEQQEQQPHFSKE